MSALDQGPQTPARSDDRDVEQFGYKQQFSRTLHSFTSFAIAFSFISVTTGLFVTYGFLLTTSGPRGLWMWIPAAIGQLLVACVLAHLAARIPLSGQTYQWASRLANPFIGWGFGWLTWAYLVIVPVSVDYALASQAFMPLFNIEPTAGNIELITIATLCLQAAFIVISTRAVALLNGAAVVTEIVGLIGLTIVLLAAVALFGGDGNLSNLTSYGIAESGPGYYAFFGPFFLAVLVGGYTIVGFDAAANLAEETEDPRRVTPKAMIRAVALSGIVGLAFLIALTVAIGDVTGVSESAAPVAAILQDQLGTGVEKFFLAFVCISMFACGLVIMISGSRIAFAMSRDKRFPGHQLFSRVGGTTKTPIEATLLGLAAGIALIVILGTESETLVNLFTASTIMPALFYLGMVLLYVVYRRRIIDHPAVFSLGRWEWPVVVLSIAWLVWELIVIVSPNATGSWTPAKIVGIVLAAGAVVFAGLMIWQRHHFETAPDDQGKGGPEDVPSLATGESPS